MSITLFLELSKFDFCGNKLNADVGELLFVHIIDILWAFFWVFSCYSVPPFKVGVGVRASVEEEGNIVLLSQSDQESSLRILLSLKLFLSKEKRFLCYGVRTFIFSWTRELSTFLVLSSSIIHARIVLSHPSLMISLLSINAFEHKYKK